MENIVFKKALFGFDRRAVLSYIARQQEKNQQEQNNLHQLMEQKETDYQEIRNRAGEMEEQLAEARRQVEALTEELNQIRQSTQKTARRAEEQEREARIQAERGRQLQFRVESMEYKAKRYDELSLEMGQSLIEAKHTAKQIIDEASARSQEILRQSAKTSEEIEQGLMEFHKEIESLREASEQTSAALYRHLEQLDNKLDEARSRLKVNREEVAEGELEVLMIEG